MALATFTIRFDAPTGNYVVSTAGRSQTFRPADLVASLSTGEANIYERTTGSTTDSLSVSKNSVASGTLAAPQYRYVGGGVWQRTVQSTSGISGTADAYAYGVTTPVAAVPRTGSADYAVQLRGVVAYGDGLLASRGSGTLSANFATGGLSGTGGITVYNTSGTPNEPERRWATAASISATANSFVGNFGLGRPGNAGVVDQSGSILGKFYGPAAEELGASWLWHDSQLATSFVGYLLGKKTTLFPSNGALDSLSVNETFQAGAVALNANRDNTNGVLTFNSSFSGGGGIASVTPTVTYAESSQSFTARFSPLVDPLVALVPANRNASSSSATFDAYSFTRDFVFNGNQRVTATINVSLFKPGAANTQLALSYTGFGHWAVVQPDFSRAPRYDNIQEGAFAFGRATPASGVPRTGTGSYSGLIYGYSAIPRTTASTQNAYVLTGTSSLTFDFAALTFTGSMRPSARDRASGQQYDLGTINFGSTPAQPITAGSPDFIGNFTRQFTFIPGSLQGHFTGPAANEFWANWATGITDPVNGGDLAILGIMVGKKN